MTKYPSFRKYLPVTGTQLGNSALVAPLAPVEKLSINRTVCFSKGTVVPPDVITTTLFFCCAALSTNAEYFASSMEKCYQDEKNPSCLPTALPQRNRGTSESPLLPFSINSLRRMKRRLKKRPVFCHHYWQQRRQDYRLWFIISYMFRVLRNCAVLKRSASTPFLRSLSAAVGFEFGLGNVRDSRSYDLVVIGGGSGGISCAQEASANGT